MQVFFNYPLEGRRLGDGTKAWSLERGAVNPQGGRRKAETQNSEPRTVNREEGQEPEVRTAINFKF